MSYLSPHVAFEGEVGDHTDAPRTLLGWMALG